MVHTRFDRPCGAQADVMELEYISALHQTDLAELRLDASIKDADIRHFLSSRYGITVSDEEVRSTILQGLGGSDEEDESIDIVELTAILMIPILLKAGYEVDGTPLPPGVLPAPKGMLDYVLKMILSDVTRSSQPQELTPALMKKILRAYGENGIAQDETMVQAMIDEALGHGNNNNTDVENRKSSTTGMLDLESFCTALTHDIQLYDVADEARLSTFISDVERDEFQPTSSARERLRMGTKKFDKVFTAPEIDLTAETYRSQALLVLIWGLTAVTFVGFLFEDLNMVATLDCRELDYTGTWRDNDDALFCSLGDTILRFLQVFFGIAAYGVTFVWLGSLGNDVHAERWYLPLIAAAFLGFIVFGLNQTSEGPAEYQYPRIAALIAVSVVILLHLAHVLSMVVPQEHLEKTGLFRLISASTVHGEREIKVALAHKLSLMVNNALHVIRQKDKNSVLETHFGQALLAYSEHGSHVEPTGGIFWAWRSFCNREITRKEGVWFPARLMVGSMVQIFLIPYILLQGIRLAKDVREGFDEEQSRQTIYQYVDFVVDRAVDDDQVTMLAANISMVVNQFTAKLAASDLVNVNCSAFEEFTAAQNLTSSLDVVDSLCSRAPEGLFPSCTSQLDTTYLCGLLTDSQQQLDSFSTLGLIEGSGFNVNLLRDTARSVLQTQVDNSIESLFPSSVYILTIPLYVGICVATLVAFKTFFEYLPSVTSTILKLRSGVIPTLRNKDFGNYRKATDQVAILTGSLFWGSLATSILVGALVAALIFFFLWQGTAFFAQQLVGILLGVICITIVRLGAILSCRGSFYKAFYRKKPAKANIAILALEWATFALSAGFVILRMIKLVVAAAFSIGRIDSPFVAPGVGKIGPVELDNYPTVHLKDVLSHEAHRHPYIEQLGKIYLMKLKYGEAFGQTTGSLWRLIFINALMPWLHQYRILAREGEGPEQTDEHQTLRFLDLRKSTAVPTKLQRAKSAALVTALGTGAESEALNAIEEEENDDNDDAPPEPLNAMEDQDDDDPEKVKEQTETVVLEDADENSVSKPDAPAVVVDSVLDPAASTGPNSQEEIVFAEGPNSKEAMMIQEATSEELLREEELEALTIQQQQEIEVLRVKMQSLKSENEALKVDLEKVRRYFL